MSLEVLRLRPRCVGNGRSGFVSDRLSRHKADAGGSAGNFGSRPRALHGPFSEEPKLTGAFGRGQTNVALPHGGTWATLMLPRIYPARRVEGRPR